ncbi:hypothetical protein SO694_00046132 [Aureococcus anophagefferens]|uniref:EF-hand domain-containing protein n=1 Tax=Aureococcus anophagefferens TaxID=44056 RepID=A0ABR1G7B4_AURAN
MPANPRPRRCVTLFFSLLMIMFGQAVAFWFAYPVGFCDGAEFQRNCEAKKTLYADRGGCARVLTGVAKRDAIAAFARFDTDGSGAIESYEFVCAMEAMGLPKPSNKDVSRMMGGAEELDRDQFLAMMAQHPKMMARAAALGANVVDVEGGGEDVAYHDEDVGANHEHLASRPPHVVGQNLWMNLGIVGPSITCEELPPESYYALRAVLPVMIRVLKQRAELGDVWVMEFRFRYFSTVFFVFIAVFIVEPFSVFVLKVAVPASIYEKLRWMQDPTAVTRHHRCPLFVSPIEILPDDVAGCFSRLGVDPPARLVDVMKVSRQGALDPPDKGTRCLGHALARVRHLDKPVHLTQKDVESALLSETVKSFLAAEAKLRGTRELAREENDVWWKSGEGASLRDWHDRTLFKEPPYYLISLVSVACILFLNPAVRGCIIKQSMIMLGLVVCGFPTPSTVEAVLLKMNDHVPGIMPVLLAWFLVVLTTLITIAAFKVRSWLTFVRRTAGEASQQVVKTAGEASQHVVKRLSASGSSAGVSLFTDDDGKHDARSAADRDEEAKFPSVVLQFDEPELGPPPPLVPCPPPGGRDEPEVEHFSKSDEAKSASEEALTDGDGLEIDRTGDATDEVGAFVVKDEENVAAVLEKVFDDGTVEEVEDIGALRLRQTLSTHRSVSSLTLAHDCANDEEEHRDELTLVKRCLGMVEKPKITAALVYAKPGQFDREGPSSPAGLAAGSPKSSRMQSRLTSSAKGQWSKAMGEFRKILFPQ